MIWDVHFKCTKSCILTCYLCNSQGPPGQHIHSGPPAFQGGLDCVRLSIDHVPHSIMFRGNPPR